MRQIIVTRDVTQWAAVFIIREEDGWDVASVGYSRLSVPGRVWPTQFAGRPVHLLPQRGGGVPVDR